jgi:Uma2 family endonuclease
MSPAAVAEKLISAEEYADMADSSRCTELVRGRIVELTPPKPRHGRICVRIAALLEGFVDEHGLGRVIGNDSGVITERGPDTVRGADVAFYSYARLPQNADLDDYPASPPELVVEVKSPTDRWSDMGAVANWWSAGV